ncbi:CHAT domain-containing protein [Muricoccus pecuniae]|uniref:CHAT domain-containing protein n=1 Tax=Muricoccus pecuniae TaxID=693023 RepID=A0A840YIU9_9PROT|nr:CHAT domain-containing protein [Roseomonas pecuniae]MBB5696517.1 hypothetical protein [Roseomonas pecuniae]
MNTATVPQAELDSYAERLGAVLLRGGVGGLYGEARAQGVRVNLLINDCDLQRIPWEYLCGPGELPTPDADRAVTRIVACRTPPGPRFRSSEKRDLRVLLAVSREAGDTFVPLEEMTATLRRKFALRMPTGGVTLEVRAVATKRAFFDAVREPEKPWDIMHYLGHGEVRQFTGAPVGVLLLTNDAGRIDSMRAQQFATMVSGVQPRLVLLTACNSAEPAVAAPFANMARALVSSGVPAVVANQMAIPADTVAEFCGGLYDKLLRCGDIDEAVNAGRLRSHTTLARGDEDTASIEWGIPVLYRAPSAQLLFPEFA